MIVLDAGQRRYLEDMFGERANLDIRERRLYSHDIAAIPKLVKPLIGNTTPSAVVQPESEDELVELVRWAGRQGIPLVPRGKASSGYGGAVPVGGGIVVDFFRMKDVLKIDSGSGTVTVEPGITWEQLDRRLAPSGLTLRLYPSSYPSST
ncbi:MAG: FAD-dependent oxidoreductase, partial [Actinobacteria bacterium]|nr:FAD-dependent oxidoreductase [Actinomycetota bacterium]